MLANRKIVLKGFDYMHCDDFAKYLSDMAAKDGKYHISIAEVPLTITDYRDSKDVIKDTSIYEDSNFLGSRTSYIITEIGREMLQKEYDRLMIMVEDGRLYFKKIK